jgi:hypothetical protein
MVTSKGGELDDSRADTIVRIVNAGGSGSYDSVTIGSVWDVNGVKILTRGPRISNAAIALMGQSLGMRVSIKIWISC